MRLLFMADLLGRTVTYGDASMVSAVRFDRNYTPIHRYSRALAPGLSPGVARLKAVLFPFEIRTREPHSKRADLAIVPMGSFSIIGVLLSFGLLFLIRRRLHGKPVGFRAWEVGLICLTGIYGVGMMLVETGTGIGRNHGGEGS